MFLGIRTTIGQERIVSEFLHSKLRQGQQEIAAIAVIPELRGYIIVETKDEGELRKLIYKAPHVRGLVKGEIKIEEISHFFETKAVTSGIERGDTVEITSGAFKGEMARVIRIDQNKEKVTVEIIEAAVPIPVTVDASAIRVVGKQTGESK